MTQEDIQYKQNTVTWSNLEYVLEYAEWIFAEFKQPELRERALEWLKQAWEILSRAGMATYSTDKQLCEVEIRCMSLVDLYLEFYGVVWEDYVELDYLEWAGEFGLSDYHIRYLIDTASNRNRAKDKDEQKEEVNASELQSLLHKFRKQILSSLLDGFGNIARLFVSLWQSNHPEIEEDNEEDDCYETDYEIQNYLTAEELAAFRWLYKECLLRSVKETQLPQNWFSAKDSGKSWIEKLQNEAGNYEDHFLYKTFDLIGQLHNNRNKDFYLAHKDEFIRYVEKPFQRLFCQITAQLPNEITQRLEMTPPIFYSPPLNFYYEGSFYPKGSNSLSDAQLFISLGNVSISFGVFIGADSCDQERFLFNCRLNSEVRAVLLQQDLAKECIVYSSNKNDSYSQTLEALLKNPARRKNRLNKNIIADVYLNQYQILHFSFQELSNYIAHTFKRLFPFILLATSYDPMPAIREYFNSCNQSSISFSYQSNLSLETTKLDSEDSFTEEPYSSSVFIRRYSEPSFTEVCQKVHSRGLRISDSTLRRYHLALKTRKFIIISGISGTGKTWLSKAYAEAVEAEYLLVPVAPNWTTNEDLLGYLSPIDNKYHDTDFSTFLKNAEDEYQQAQSEKRTPIPYHLVLDEMNLARVEYYFAKFLSAMEVRMREGVTQIQLASEKQVLLPPNLYFIGTVNVDETTYSFADKVYDRAQLIELEVPRQDLYEHLGEAPYREILMQIWDEVHTVAPFAFRVLDEIKTYVKEAEALDVSWQDALDEQLLQKILPKLKGADDRVGVALKAFVDIVKDKDFPLSHKKATKMLETFNQHGFTSYF